MIANDFGINTISHVQGPAKYELIFGSVENVLVKRFLNVLKDASRFQISLYFCYSCCGCVTCMLLRRTFITCRLRTFINCRINGRTSNWKNDFPMDCFYMNNILIQILRFAYFPVTNNSKEFYRYFNYIRQV